MLSYDVWLMVSWEYLLIVKKQSLIFYESNILYLKGYA